MNRNPLSVLIVDDSALMRNLISRIIEDAGDLVVGATAINGDFALKKIPGIKPDVIILDLEMPGMNGIEFLKERKKLGINIPVIILSSIAEKGADITIEALSLGASDFILKPSGSISRDIHVVSEKLLSLIRGFGNQYRRYFRKENEPREAEETPPAVRETEKLEEQSTTPDPCRQPEPVEIIVIGISTGGPAALREVFSRMNSSLSVPIVVVQHMPAEFTKKFAESLNRISPLEIREAKNGDIIRPGRVLIAPGNQHIELEKRSLASIVCLNSNSRVNGHRPSADVLFSSAAKYYGKNAMGVIMTGMGKDGAKEIGSIYKKGGITIGQDEESSIVFGMPNVAIQYGFITHIVSLGEMADKIQELVQKYS